MYRLILGLCLQDKAVAQESRQKRLFHHCKQAIKFPQYTVKSTLCVCVSLCVCVYVYSCVSFIIVWSSAHHPDCDPSDRHTPVPLWSHLPLQPPAATGLFSFTYTEGHTRGVMLYVTFEGGIPCQGHAWQQGDLSPVMLTSIAQVK